MSVGHTGASSTDNEEHRSVNGINAKAVFPYNFPTHSKRFDLQDPIYYIGIALPGSATSAAAWTITKIDLTDLTAGTGKITSVNAIWDNRASETYS